MKTLFNIFKPTCIDDIIGQEHILGKGRVLRGLIENNNIHNLILYGNSGVGKSCVANILCASSNKKTFKINGSTASSKDIQDAINSLNTLEGYNGVILYIEQIDAMSKNRQISFLEYLETNEITLIATTTENPYYNIHPTILSRCMLFEFKSLSTDNITKRLKTCLSKVNNSVRCINYDDDALEYLANISNGDLRKAINTIEVILNSQINKEIYIDINKIKEVSQKNISINKSEYYDLVSMLFKSIRGSDVDASILSFSLLMSNGIEVNNIIRFLLIIASKDCIAMGNMYSTFYSLTEAAKQVDRKSAHIILTHAVIILANAEKSDSAFRASKSVMDDIENINIGDIQPHLKNHHLNNKHSGENTTGYKYPHNYPNNYVKQEYMPSNMKDRVYYVPGNNKYENEIKEYWDKIKK